MNPKCLKSQNNLLSLPQLVVVDVVIAVVPCAAYESVRGLATNVQLCYLNFALDWDATVASPVVLLYAAVLTKAELSSFILHRNICDCKFMSNLSCSFIPFFA